jgi:hypothetical protein
MRTPILFALAAVLAAVELPAQGRGRRGQRPGGEAEAPAPQATPETPAAEQKPKRHLAIVGGDVYVGTGQRLTGATVLIADDKIAAVGHNLTLPENTELLDAKGHTVSPGFVAVQGFGMGSGRSAPFGDSVNPFDPEIKQGLAAGITSFLAGSANGRGTPAGGNAVIKLAYGSVEQMVLQEDSVVGLSVPLSTQDREKLRELVQQAKDYLQAVLDFPKTKAADPKAKEPQAPRGAEKVIAVLAGKAQLWVTLGAAGFNPFGGGRRGGGGASDDVDAIRAALELAQWFGRGVVIQKPTSAWLVPDEIAATGSMVIWSPRTRVPADPKNPDRTGSNLATAAILAGAGVPVAVTCPSGMFGGAGVGTGGILGQDLNTPHVDAAYAVRGGLDNRKALRTITLDAARMLGVDRRVGSLEAGKDADVLILDGDPLHYATFVTVAVVNGKVVYEKAKDPLYRHISR